LIQLLTVNRIKSFLEGGSSKSKAKSDANSAEKAADQGKKQTIRGKRKCTRCGELGHGESSYKCALNGTKKRKRNPRKNTTRLKINQLRKLPRKQYWRTVLVG
jgi:hypothetical protein